MKLIILAAGEGSRLRPLTNTIPKPLIKIVGKTIVEHNLENILSDENKSKFNEIIFIVKYKKEKFVEYFGSSYNGIKISYKTQGDKKGTGGALMGLGEISDDILIINGDSIFDKQDLNKIIKFSGYGILTQKVEFPEKYGICQIKSDNTINKIIEKPQEFIGNLANLGVYKFNAKIFEYIINTPLSERGEYELIEALNEFAENYPLKAIEISGDFIDIGYPWDILTANIHFLNKLSESTIDGKIENGVVIKGNIILEKGAILKSGTYIEGNCYIGKNTSIGPNIFIRGTTCIGENCKIGANNEIKNSNIGDSTNIAHLSYIGDSIIGNNVNIGGGFITANLRHDKANIKVPIKGILTDTGLHKLGIIIGDNVKTGIKAYSMPGRVIENDSLTMPGELIK